MSTWACVSRCDRVGQVNASPMAKSILPIGRLALLVWIATSASAAALVPLERAHAHNDYEHARPLLDALDQGFCSVEADIHLIQGHLLVGHDPRQLRPDRTLQSLYLDPLKKRIAENGGRVYRDGPTVTLMIDVKSD